VLQPATRKLYWKGPVDVKVEVVKIETDYEVPRDKVALVARARPGELLKSVTDTVYPVEVLDAHIGLLFVDGELVKTLKPGVYAYWRFNRNIKVEQVDTRVQTTEVQGQEILTKDKVSLRVNLSAAYKVVDAVKARKQLVDFVGFLYRELQFALRQAVGTRTLDVLLTDKGALDASIEKDVRAKVAEHGIEVKSVGVKDVILPGEMKTILNQVVEAEKAAQANIIKRREETAATRSLLNTAKLMGENPILVRLKELEVLEKVTDKIEKLTVFGGLDGVLQDMVKINVKAE
jgi:regulator of protease activity HflC (stomatin/prohibitin superfamily)